MGGDALRLRGTEARSVSDARRHHRLVPTESGILQMSPHGDLHGTAQDFHGQDPEVPTARDGAGPQGCELRGCFRHYASDPKVQSHFSAQTMLSSKKEASDSIPKVDSTFGSDALAPLPYRLALLDEGVDALCGIFR